MRAWTSPVPRPWVPGQDGRYDALPARALLATVDWTLALAIYGAVVATASVVATVATHLAAGPRLEVVADGSGAEGPYGEFGVIASIVVANTGRGEITIDEIDIQWPFDSYDDPEWVPTNPYRFTPLPYRMPGKSSMTFEYHTIRRFADFSAILLHKSKHPGPMTWVTVPVALRAAGETYRTSFRVFVGDLYEGDTRDATSAD
jgi:hypothetical protein